MNNYSAIKVVELGKKYRIGARRERYGTIRDSISDGVRNFFRPSKSKSRAAERNGHGEIWALKGINFEIQQGEIVGIIGRNGAGKSTLLKTLSRITEPTEGFIDIAGRVGAILEVGTGFHLELTGRENLYLSGSILGMNKAEIDRHFDEIVAFSEVEKFIDTPVKHYSSGMYLRLAFGVAAHLNPEILLIDEVLAVGDANFQKKCLGKMGDVAQQGRTVLFVSHNMSAIQELCHRGILIESGQVAYDGRAMDCVAEYYKRSNSSNFESERHTSGRPMEIGAIKVNDSIKPIIESGEGFEVSLELDGREIINPRIFFVIENVMGHPVIHNRVSSKDIGLERIDGTYILRLSVPGLWLSPGVYSMYFKILASSIQWEGRINSERLLLEVHGEMENTGKAILHPKVKWRVDSYHQNNVESL